MKEIAFWSRGHSLGMSVGTMWGLILAALLRADGDDNQ